MTKLFLYAFIYALCNGLDLNEYKIKREQIIKDEAALLLGGNTSLNEKELELNNCLMNHKYTELDDAIAHPENLSFSQHYFSYKAGIRNSKVYKIIKDMPKGAVLHLHDRGHSMTRTSAHLNPQSNFLSNRVVAAWDMLPESVVSATSVNMFKNRLDSYLKENKSILGVDYLMNLTYMDNLYVCFDDNIQFKFSADIPPLHCQNNWKMLSEMRNTSTNVTKFDADLSKNFNLVAANPEVTYPTIEETWKAFMNFLNVVDQLITYKPVWEKYFYDSLKAFKEHNIMYIEVRSVLPNLYDLNGTVFDALTTAKVYQSAIQNFQNDNPEFMGAKLIYSPFRTMDKAQLEDHIAFAEQLQEIMPHIFAGFDIVGQEDLGRPLIDFVPQLLDSKIDFYFHAGETNWNGYTDNNLIDAILLRSKRIGHAFALNKHPVLMKKVLENDIAIEVNVISNAVLSLVRDVRNHPLSVYLSQGLPVVLSSDDSGAWDGDVISEDYYIAFVAIANRNSDLKLLKTLFLNSLKYSALGFEEKNKAMVDYDLKWNSFVDNFDCTLY